MIQEVPYGPTIGNWLRIMDNAIAIHVELDHRAVKRRYRDGTGKDGTPKYVHAICQVISELLTLRL